jgi:hypothetical protein
MSHPVFYVPAGDVLPIIFGTYAGSTGASVTLTGLAVTDIEIYKDGSVTQRSSDAGYTLLDTDGIDFDSVTGIHGFSIDTGDNTDAGFYTVGAWFTVVVSAVTVDSQTVNFVAAQFRVMPAESGAGVPKVDVSHWLGTAAATPTTAGVPEVDVTYVGGVLASAGVVDANVVQISGDSTAADNLESYCDGTTPQPVNVTDWLGQDVLLDASNRPQVSVLAFNGTTIDLTGGTNAAGFFNNDSGLAGVILGDITTIDNLIDTEIGTLTTNLATVAGYLDTEIAAIKAKTDNLPAAPAATGDIPSAATIAAAVWAYVVENSKTALQYVRIIKAAVAGKLSGAATTTVAIRDDADTKDRISATVDSDGNRSAVTLDGD